MEAKDRQITGGGGSTLFLRRPLLVVFVSLIVFIGVWYHVAGPEQPGQYVKEHVECMGRVEEIQVRKTGRVIVLSDIEVVSADAGLSEINEKILLYDSSEQNLFVNSRQGNTIRISGTYSSMQRAGNPGEFDEFAYYQSKGIGGKLFAESLELVDSHYKVVSFALFSLRQRAVQQLFSIMEEEDAGILSAMLLGEKAYLPQEEKTLYQQTGISHVLVISGLHVSLLAAGLFLFLRKYVMAMKKAAVLTILFLFLYGQFTGFPVATTRAVLMMCCMLFARYTGRSYDPLSALSLSGILTLIQEPAQLFQCGFLLSYTAVGGILLFAPVFEKADIKSVFVKSFCSGAAVTVSTLPVMLWFFYEICPYSVLANMLILPFLSLLIGTGMAGCILAFFSTAAGGFLLASAHYLLKFYELVCRLVEKLPMNRVVTGRPSGWSILLYYAILCATICFYLYKEEWREKYKWSWKVSMEKWLLYAGVAAVCFVTFTFPPESDFLYTQLDVGQGDCACLFYGDKTYLIDGGSSSEKEIGTYVIEKFLKYYGRRRIDGIFITHSDSDHTNGIAELVQNRHNWGLSVGNIIMPEIQNQDDNYQTLLRMFEENNMNVLQMKKGDCLSEDMLYIRCLHPFPEYEWSSENDYSLTLQIDYRNIRILTTGDLEEQGEQMVSGLCTPCDLLKVGHHGSKTSTSPDFLKAASPVYAVISAGRDNRYGHPAQITLERLNENGTRIFSTIEHGAVFVEWKGGEKRVYSYLTTHT